MVAALEHPAGLTAAGVKLREHRRALDLLEHHPGWSDRRIARLLAVAPSTVGRWRWAAGLEPYTKKASRRRRQLVP